MATVAGPVLYLQLLTGCELTAQLPDGPLGVEVTTRYPWAGTAEIKVTAAPASQSGLAVRIPSWASGVSVRVNGQRSGRPGPDGYLVVSRRWQDGDVLSVTMDMTPRLTYPSRRIDALRGTAAVERGPLVYCFEQADQPRRHGSGRPGPGARQPQRGGRRAGRDRPDDRDHRGGRAPARGYPGYRYSRASWSRCS